MKLYTVPRPLTARHSASSDRQLGQNCDAAHILRAPFKTGVAGGTEPDELTGKDLLLHSQNGHPDDFPWIVPVRNLADRAARCTGSTGETAFDVFSSRLLGNEKPKVRIKGFGIDHYCLPNKGSRVRGFKDLSV